MRKYTFEYHGHKVTITHHPDADEISDVIQIVDAPCSIPLVIVNAFEFMLENGVWNLSIDDVRITRLT